MSLFQLDDFKLHSGEASPFLIDADALTDADLETLAFLIAESVGEFSAVEGVPRGGLRLAKALTLFASPAGPLLIVDDVYTTGASMEERRRGRAAVGWVIFARRPVRLWWVRALFTLNNSSRWD